MTEPLGIKRPNADGSFGFGSSIARSERSVATSVDTRHSPNDGRAAFRGSGKHSDPNTHQLTTA